LGLRRRARARKRTPVGTAEVVAEAIALPVVTPVEEEEEPGWAGLLAAYEFSPRESDGLHEYNETVDEIASDPAEELDPGRLRQLIVQHDLAQADAYFRPDGDQSVFEAATEEPAGLPARRQGDSDVQRLSSTLLEASLIALAALVAARLLRQSD
jgi:hypothetical protein